MASCFELSFRKCGNLLQPTCQY